MNLEQSAPISYQDMVANRDLLRRIAALLRCEPGHVLDRMDKLLKRIEQLD
jgi:hypothetical protein